MKPPATAGGIDASLTGVEGRFLVVAGRVRDGAGAADHRRYAVHHCRLIEQVQHVQTQADVAVAAELEGVLHEQIALGEHRRPPFAVPSEVADRVVAGGDDRHLTRDRRPARDVLADPD